MPPDLVRRLAKRYRSDTAALGALTVEAVARQWDDLDGRGPFPVIAAATVAAANRAAVTMADAYLADALTVTLARPVLADAAETALYASLPHLEDVLRGTASTR